MKGTFGFHASTGLIKRTIIYYYLERAEKK